MQPESDAQLPEWVVGLTSALDDKMNLTLTAVSPQRVAGFMPVAGNTQPFGMWHGGASAVLVETLGSLGAAAVGYPDRVGVGVDLNVTHLRPVATGHVHGEATPVRIGQRTVTYQVNLADDAGEQIATGRLTCQLVNRPQH